MNPSMKVGISDPIQADNVVQILNGNCQPFFENAGIVLLSVGLIGAAFKSGPQRCPALSESPI